MLIVLDQLIFFDQWGSSWPVWTVLISFMGWDHVVGLTNSFLFFFIMSMVLDQLIVFDICDGFWPVWLILIQTMLLVRLVVFDFFDHVDGFWPCRWFWTSWLFSTDGMVPDHFEWFWSVLWVHTMLLVILVDFFFFFDDVDDFSPFYGFGPVDCFRPMRWFLNSLNGFDQCYGLRPCCWSYWWFLSFFDHVDGLAPVDCFRLMRWFLTSLIDIDQYYGFRTCCWSYWWFLTFLTDDEFWPCRCFWISWLFFTN